MRLEEKYYVKMVKDQNYKKFYIVDDINQQIFKVYVQSIKEKWDFKKINNFIRMVNLEFYNQ